MLPSKFVQNEKVDLVLFKGKETKETLDAFLRGCQLVLYYELPSDNLADAFIVLSNKALLDQLHTLGQESVMIDGTHGSNAYGLTLTTVQVRMPNLEHRNVAFCLSGSQGSETIAKFFGLIIPPGFETKVFMSDMFPAYWNAWNAVASPPRSRRICEWHLLRAWRKSATDKAKIMEKSIINDLLAVLHLSSPDELELQFGPLRERLENNPSTKLFNHYLERYSTTFPPETWARCYVDNSGPIRNMYLETWHKQLKHGEEQSGLPCLDLMPLLRTTQRTPWTKRWINFRGKLSKIRGFNGSSHYDWHMLRVH